MSKDTFYFSHDYNARTDKKIKQLILKHGLLGYGIFWAIIEDLYNNANALPTDYESIAFDLRSDKNIIESIVTGFDLFVFEGGSFGSSSVQKRLEERNSKSVKAKESALKRWGKDANALPTQSESNAIKERKGKERKEDLPPSAEFDFKKSLVDYGFDQQLIKDWVKVRKTKRGTNTETAYEAFISEVEKTGKDKNKVLKLCVIKSWAGFKSQWYEDPEDISTEKCPYTPEQLRIFRANLSGQGSPGKDFDMKWIKELQ